MNLSEAHDEVTCASLDMIAAVGHLQSALSSIEKANNRLKAVQASGVPLVSDNGCDFPTTSASFLNMTLNAVGKGHHVLTGLNQILDA